MSEFKQIVEIKPPSDSRVHEMIKFENFTCPQCHGAGGTQKIIGHNRYLFTSCPHCDGTGKVKAEVIINWSPDYDH